MSRIPFETNNVMKYVDIQIVNKHIIYFDFLLRLIDVILSTLHKNTITPHLLMIVCRPFELGFNDFQFYYPIKDTLIPLSVSAIFTLQHRNFFWTSYNAKHAAYCFMFIMLNNFLKNLNAYLFRLHFPFANLLFIH